MSNGEPSEQLERAATTPAPPQQVLRTAGGMTIPYSLIHSPLHRPVTVDQLTLCRSGQCGDCYNLAGIKSRYEIFVQPYVQAPTPQQQAAREDQSQEQQNDEERTIQEDNAAFDIICDLEKEKEALHKQVKRLQKKLDKKTAKLTALRKKGGASLQNEVPFEDRSARDSVEQNQDVPSPINLPEASPPRNGAASRNSPSIKSESSPLPTAPNIPCRNHDNGDSSEEDNRPLVKKSRGNNPKMPSRHGNIADSSEDDDVPLVRKKDGTKSAVNEVVPTRNEENGNSSEDDDRPLVRKKPETKSTNNEAISTHHGDNGDSSEDDNRPLVKKKKKKRKSKNTIDDANVKRQKRAPARQPPPPPQIYEVYYDFKYDEGDYEDNVHGEFEDLADANEAAWEVMEDQLPGWQSHMRLKEFGKRQDTPEGDEDTIRMFETIGGERRFRYEMEGVGDGKVYVRPQVEGFVPTVRMTLERYLEQAAGSD